VTRIYSNVAVEATTTDGINSTATTIPVNSTAGWPTPGGFDVAVGAFNLDGPPATRELFTYTGKTATTLTGVVRGIDGTTAQSHAAGSLVVHAMPASDMQRISGGPPTNAILRGAGTSRRYFMTRTIDVNLTTTPVHGQAWFSPVPAYGLLDRIRIEVVTAGTGVLRLGIYGQDEFGRPGPLRRDIGTVDVDTSGYKALVIDPDFDAGMTGLIWCVYVWQGDATTSPVMRRATGAFGNVPMYIAPNNAVFHNRSYTFCSSDTNITGPLPANINGNFQLTANERTPLFAVGKD